MVDTANVLRFYICPLLLWPIFIALAIALIPFCVFIFIIRNLEYLLYHCYYNAVLLNYEDIVWTMETPENQLLINSSLIVDGILPISKFSKLIDDRFVNYRDLNGKLHYWKATKRIRAGCINFYWVEDEHFDLKKHVYELQTTRVTSENELRQVLSRHRSTKLSYENGGSPWEFVLIPYQVSNCHKTVIFARLSHALADGSALAYFLVNQLGSSKEKIENNAHLKFSQIRKGFTKYHRYLLHLKALWIFPVVQLSTLLAFKDNNALHVSKATGTKCITWTNPLDLENIKSVKNRLGCTVNDVLMGCLAKTLNDYFKMKDTICPRAVSLIFPLDIRSSPEEAVEFGNRVAVVKLKLPTTNTDLITLIQDTKRRMNYIKTSGEPIGSFLGWKVVSFLLPRFLSKLFVFFVVGKTTGSLSNLVGPFNTILISDNKLESVLFWPPQTYHHGFGAAFCSYNGKILIGVESDHATLTDPAIITKIFEDNIKKLSCTTEEGYIEQVQDTSEDMQPLYNDAIV